MPESVPDPISNPVSRLRLLAFALAVLILAGAGWVMSRPDPRYSISDWLSLGRYDRYDALIADAARKHGVDPLLIKAVIWQESRFRPHMTGGHGERGLMQIGEAAASDWVRIHKVETFVPTDLFSPRTNVEIGTWYLKQSLHRWRNVSTPIPLALAEYNAGKTHVFRWIRESGNTPEQIHGEAFRDLVGYPSTRAYIAAIERRYDYYRSLRK